MSDLSVAGILRFLYLSLQISSHACDKRTNEGLTFILRNDKQGLRGGYGAVFGGARRVGHGSENLINIPLGAFPCPGYIGCLRVSPLLRICLYFPLTNKQWTNIFLAFMNWNFSSCQTLLSHLPLKMTKNRNWVLFLNNFQIISWWFFVSSYVMLRWQYPSPPLENIENTPPEPLPPSSCPE